MSFDTSVLVPSTLKLVKKKTTKSAIIRHVGAQDSFDKEGAETSVIRFRHIVFAITVLFIVSLLAGS